MGWDASTNLEIYKNGNIKSRKLRISFKDAVTEVLKHADTVDGYLSVGGLDCSECARMLEKATGVSCYNESWDNEEVKELNISANWVFKYEEAWAYWSAKIFLKTCSENDLAISFSW